LNGAEFMFALHPNPAQFGSARVSTYGELVYDLTLITISLERVGIYIPLKLLLPIQCGTNNQRQIEEKSSFPSKNQIHIQQAPPKLEFKERQKKLI